MEQTQIFMIWIYGTNSKKKIPIFLQECTNFGVKDFKKISFFVLNIKSIEIYVYNKKLN